MLSIGLRPGWRASSKGEEGVERGLSAEMSNCRDHRVDLAGCCLGESMDGVCLAVTEVAAPVESCIYSVRRVVIHSNGPE